MYYPFQGPAAKEWLGIEPEADTKDGKPHLDLEDYLSGLIQMSNELVCNPHFSNGIFCRMLKIISSF